MDSEKRNSKSQQVAPIGAALTPGLVTFWSPKWKGFDARRQSLRQPRLAEPPTAKPT